MNLAGMIDHTMLKADAPRDVIVRYCEEAKQYEFASVCVNSCRVPLVAQQLQGSDVKVCCVVGFPLGAMLTEAKAAEAKYAVAAGAQEVDMVINIGWMKDKDYEAVQKDIEAVREATGKNAILKVIIETCLLTDEEKVKACELSVAAGADFVKTSTGFSTGGATAEDVALMKKTVDGSALVKASGGIRTNADALRMVEAGADRIGVGNGVPLLGA